MIYLANCFKILNTKNYFKFELIIEMCANKKCVYLKQVDFY